MGSKVDITFKSLSSIEELKQLWKDVPEDVLSEAKETLVWSDFYDKPLLYLNKAPYYRDGKVNVYNYVFVVPIIEIERQDKWTSFTMHLQKFAQMTQKGIVDVDVEQMRLNPVVFKREKDATERRIQAFRKGGDDKLQGGYDDLKKQKKVQICMQLVDAVIVGKSAREFVLQEENEDILRKIGDDGVIMNVIAGVTEDIYKKKGGFSSMVN